MLCLSAQEDHLWTWTTYRPFAGTAIGPRIPGRTASHLVKNALLGTPFLVYNQGGTIKDFLLGGIA